MRMWLSRGYRSELELASSAAGRACSGEREGEIAELLDRGDDLVAGLEPDLFVLRIARDDALRRACEDDVARLERKVPGNVADQLLAVEHHVGRVRGLAHLAVHPTFDLEIVSVSEIGGD